MSSSPRTARDSSPPRPAHIEESAAIALVATTLHETFREEHAAGNLGATYRAAGERAGLPHQHVGELCNPVSGRTAKLHKPIMMGKRLAARFYRKLASKLEAQVRGTLDLRDAALGVQESAGKLARCVREALTDEVISDAEDAAIEATLLAAEADIAAVRAARAQHRARGAR